MRACRHHTCLIHCHRRLGCLPRHKRALLPCIVCMHACGCKLVHACACRLPVASGQWCMHGWQGTHTTHRCRCDMSALVPHTCDRHAAPPRRTTALHLRHLPSGGSTRRPNCMYEQGYGCASTCVHTHCNIWRGRCRGQIGDGWQGRRRARAVVVKEEL